MVQEKEVSKQVLVSTETRSVSLQFLLDSYMQGFPDAGQWHVFAVDQIRDTIVDLRRNLTVNGE